MCSSHGPSHGQPASTGTAYPTKAVAPVGKKITSLYKKRLTNFFTPGQWEKVNIMA